MIRLKQFTLLLLLLISVSSCGILGVHMNVHNPKKPGKYPEFDKETILLGELSPLRKNFDVVFYDLDIDINPIEKKLGGWVEIKSIALRDIDSIQMNLDQPLAIEELRWQTRQGESLKYSREYRAVYVKLNHQIKQGESFSVHVKYSGKPIIAKRPPWAGGLVWKKDKQGNPWIGVACESEGSSIWFPCKDHTSDEPESINMRFTIPDTGLSVVSNGVFMGSENKDNTKSFSWKISYPINLYNITFYVGNFEKIEDNYVGINSKELKINHYVLKPNLEIATKHYKQVKEHIRIYEELYGEYPWYNDGFRLVESPFAGMEHQSAIALGSGYKNDLYGNDDNIMLHETGHEWFGNAITANDLAEVWLQEGFTTYGESLYLEKKYKDYKALSHLRFYRLFIKNKYPVVGPSGRRYFDYHDSDVYTKGAWILHTLRNNINDDPVFFQILKTFYQENKLKTTDSKTFIEVVNRITGKDYTWFFNQYLYQNKVPSFEYQIADDGSLYYRWINVSEGFNKLAVPIYLKVGFKEIYPDVKIQKLENYTSESISIDNNKALFETSENNRLRKLFLNQNDVSNN